LNKNSTFTAAALQAFSLDKSRLWSQLGKAYLKLPQHKHCTDAGDGTLNYAYHGKGGVRLTLEAESSPHTA